MKNFYMFIVQIQFVTFSARNFTIAWMDIPERRWRDFISILYQVCRYIVLFLVTFYIFFIFSSFSFKFILRSFMFTNYKLNDEKK